MTAQATPRDPALSCRHLWKVFGAEDVTNRSGAGAVSAEAVHELSNRVRADGGVVAAADITIDIMPGEFFVLMGLSGSGKSTLLRCLSRLTEPSSGEIIFEGRDLLALSESELRSVRRKKMGMVFQNFGLFPHMSVLDNVGFPLRVQKIGKSERDAKARAMIALVGLEGREDAMPDQLSGGQKQRVGIARSLAVDPELWFLDEPFSALDPLIRGQMQQELLGLQQKFHKTIVFVTHDFMEAVRLADRIAIMKDGIIEQIGTPAEIVLAPATDYVAEFVAEAPRSKIVRLRHLLPTGAASIAPAGNGGPMLDPDLTLEDALAISIERGGGFTVSDGKGGSLGHIDPAQMARALKGGPVHGG